MSRWMTIMMVAGCAVLVEGAWAGEPFKVEPVLEPDENLLARITTMPDNTLMKLPQGGIPAGDFSCVGNPDVPTWGGQKDFKPTKGMSTGARDYSNLMAWAPDRKRALICGGGHNSWGIDDVWEYDLAANTWALLHTPVTDYIVCSNLIRQGKTDAAIEWFKKNCIYRDGVVMNRDGGPVRIAHTWNGLCYDSKARRMLLLEPHGGLVFVDKKLIAKGLGIEEPASRRAAIWQFDPATKKWSGTMSGIEGFDGEGSTLKYIPDQDALWRSGYGGTYLYDKATKVSKQLWGHFNQAGMESIGGYVPELKLFVGFGGSAHRKTFAFSFATGKWKPAHDIPTTMCENVSDGSHFTDYDSVAGVFVVYAPSKLGILTYDPVKDEWAEPTPEGDKLCREGWGSRYCGYYDPERNVTVFHNPASGTYVYRCKKTGKLRGRLGEDDCGQQKCKTPVVGDDLGILRPDHDSPAATFAVCRSAFLPVNFFHRSTITSQ